jgi:hypothetical protein
VLQFVLLMLVGLVIISAWPALTYLFIR